MLVHDRLGGRLEAARTGQSRVLRLSDRVGYGWLTPGRHCLIKTWMFEGC